MRDQCAIASRAPGAEVFVEIDVTGVAGRGGVAPSQASVLCAQIRELPLVLAGLMTVAPVGSPLEVARCFSTVGSLCSELGLSQCSMGMSDGSTRFTICGGSI